MVGESSAEFAMLLFLVEMDDTPLAKGKRAMGNTVERNGHCVQILENGAAFIGHGHTGFSGHPK